MYSIKLNSQIKEYYSNLNQFTDKFSDFFNHMSYLSSSIKCDIENEENKSNEELDIWANRIKLINNIKDIEISFIILCKNEERCIERCLKSIFSESSNVDEVVVIDSGSTDNTKEIINSKFKETVLIETIWENDFSKLRNLGIKNAKKKWIFFIDADETLMNGSINNLRRYLKIIEWYDFNNVVISPNIINSNDHIIHEVKRIFKKDSGIQYYGKIHEEPRKDINLMGSELIFINFDNIILTHDGYKKEIIDLKNKINRNVNLLNEMIAIEPENPRWKYFLGRDGKEFMSKENYEEFLKKSILLCDTKPIFLRYKIRALSDLTGYYIDDIRLEEAKESLNKLEKINPDLSDIIYYKIFIMFIEYKKKCLDFLNELITFKNNRKNIEYGGIHSSYYHIDFLISRLLFELGEYEKSFSIIEHLEKREFGNYTKLYEKLYHSLSAYMG